MKRLRGQIGWLALAALLGATAGHAAGTNVLRFGITPVLGEQEMHANFDPLMSYLADAIGQKVVLFVAKNYGDLRAQMEAGTVDIGSFSPFAYVDATTGGKIRIIAQSIIGGSATYRGIIIAKKDSGLKTLTDLRGKRFAFVDPKSASGYIYPRAMLIENGFAPDSYFKEAIFAGNHEKVIAAVLEGKVDAGATYDSALIVEQAKHVATNDLIILASTDPIPHDAIAVRVGLDDVLAKKIQTALVNLDQTEAGRRVIANSKKMLSSHVIAEDSLYDIVRRAAKIAGQ